ncbi:hypothetical protein QQP08_017879 [Theobroma cacao]|nr:hypothetical protein QQP08_017879 [Theobroma cacao]
MGSKNLQWAFYALFLFLWASPLGPSTTSFLFGLFFFLFSSPSLPPPPVSFFAFLLLRVVLTAIVEVH